MDNDIKYQELFKVLPASLQEAILGADTTSAIGTIHQKHRLHIDKLELLENLTLDVLYGVTKPNDYVSEVEKALGVDASDAASIAVDMNSLVFQPVRASLLALHEGGANTNIDVDRGSILREIQNPTPTPISGRRYAADTRGLSSDAQTTEDSLRAGTGADMLGNSDADAPGSLASGPELEARLPNQEFASILDQKAATATTSVPTERTVDPYLENPE